MLYPSLGPPGQVLDATDGIPESTTDVPLFLGYTFSYGLQGILLVQVFYYFVTFGKDPRWLKSTVFAVLFIECLSTFFASYAALNSLLLFGELLDVAFLWTFAALAPLCGLTALIVHLFFCWRIWKITRTALFPTPIIVVSVTQCAMVTVSGILFTYGVGDSTVDHPQELSFNILWLGGSAFCDLIIAGTLVIVLLRANSKSRLRSTNIVIVKIVTLTVETGLLTALGAILELGLFLIYRNSFIHFTLFLMLPKLYANSMLATLNARCMLARSMVEPKHLTSMDSGATLTNGGPIFARNHIGELSFERSEMESTVVEISRHSQDVEQGRSIFISDAGDGLKSAVSLAFSHRPVDGHESVRDWPGTGNVLKSAVSLAFSLEPVNGHESTGDPSRVEV